MKFFIKDFFNKCDQSFLWIWSHLLKKSLMANLIVTPWKILNGKLHCGAVE